MKQAMQVLTSSETNEWLTPPHIINLVTRVLGGEIDLDPASTEFANNIVNAKRFYTVEDDGLTLDWHGSVFLNPPYGKTGSTSNQQIWASKLLSQWECGHVDEAILLTRTVPGYEWWDWNFHNWPGPMCITYGRLAFVRPEWITFDEHEDTRPTRHIVYPKGDNRSKAASSFWYLGRSVGLFYQHFSAMGRVIHETMV